MAFRLNREPKLTPKHAAFDYQRDAVEELKGLDYGAIFHEQGLGKTKIAIDLMLSWLETDQIDSVVIVVKKSLLTNWKNELAAHTHMLAQQIGQKKSANFFAFNSPARLYLTHYEAVKTELQRFKLLSKTRRLGFILDEAQKIKNPDATLTKAFHELSPHLTRRAILTGTPISNRPYDIWSLIFFLDQGEHLGENFAEFKKTLDLTAELGRDESAKSAFEGELSEVFNRISSFCVRETKNGGRIDLPEKRQESIITDWESRQNEMYEQVRDELRVVVVKDGIPTEDRSDDLLKRLLRLVQIASNPSIIDDNYHAEPGKLRYLNNLLADAFSRNEKAIVWTSFIANAKWLSAQLSEHKPAIVHGQLDMPRRDREISAFISDPDVKVLIATPGAAKEGLTLTVANHVIFYDRTFSLDDYLQAQDRIHRISQTKRCHVYNLLMRESIDEWVDVLIKTKELAARLGQGDIGLDEYQALVKYDFHDILRNILGFQEDE